MNDYQPCNECGELESWLAHLEPHGQMLITGYESHEYEPGCYCANSGRCEVCVERAIDHADYLRKAAKEG